MQFAKSLFVGCPNHDDASSAEYFINFVILLIDNHLVLIHTPLSLNATECFQMDAARVPK